jgi:membrane protease YdiL (CAAX protease family)
MRRFPLLAFFALACLITWGVWVPQALASHGMLTLPIPAALSQLAYGAAYYAGPPLAAIMVTWRVEGAGAVRDLVGRMARWRVGWQWYLIALCSRALMICLALAAGLAFGRVTPASIQALLAVSLTAILFDFLARIAVHSGEELGWRGFLLARAQTRLSPVSASVLVALLSGVWHLPLFFFVGTAQYGTPFVVFLLWLVPLSLLQTLVYNHTGGSVFLVMLLHAALNTTTTYFAIIPTELDVMVTWLTVLVIVLLAPAGLGGLRRRHQRSGVRDGDP